ncbi:MAG: phosphatidate cytidylyltransferase [Syntrophales bacterium]|nr:phosphatidate cytidylyltransferase [Syntrophales bacterium]
MDAHLKRWLTALVAVPLLLLIIGYGSELVFFFLIFSVVAAAMVEYTYMVFGVGRPGDKIPAIAIALLIVAAAFTGGVPHIFATFILSTLALCSLYLYRRGEPTTNLKSVRNTIFGVLYIAAMMSFFILLRAEDSGKAWVFFLIIMAFSTDVTAFYIGRTLGRRKLLPAVSAGKTVEGALGGIAGCMAGCLIYSLIFLPELCPLHALVMGLLGSILGQLGDLSESVVKRASMVKDSGSIIPGHGGIMDRLDSFIFMAPFVYYYKLYVLTI